ELLERNAPDLVHIATEGPLGASALMACANLRIPIVSSFHTNFDQYLAYYNCSGFEPFVSAYLAWFHNQTRVTLAPSEATRARLQEIGIKRIEIWSRGVDAGLFHPRHRSLALRRQLGLTDKDVLLLCVGRLAAEKNITALIEVYTNLRHNWPADGPAAPRLALVGDGPLAAGLQARRLPGVFLAGEKHSVELAEWFASADIFTFPSKSETFGNVILEAQASGLPVVGFRCPSVNERVDHEEDGLLAANSFNMAAAIRILAMEPARRAYYGHAAREKAERCTWNAIFDRLERLYLGSIASAETGQHKTFKTVHCGL
ncbi:MAG: glycosyltransferase family 4 protein, partial [Candidatus Acidiferrum sp.]